jgi:hypothetical protein
MSDYGRAERVLLNVYISSASDGLFTVKAVQMPKLIVHTRTIEEIPDAVRYAAAAIVGRRPEEFEVILDF